MHRLRWTGLLAAALVGSALLSGGIAWAAQTNSAKVKFGEYSQGGLQHCAKEQAYLSNAPDKMALGLVDAWASTPCQSSENRPAGWLAVRVFLIKGTSGPGGIVCGDTDWQYVMQDSNGLARGVYWSNSGSCLSGGYFARARGREWNPNTGGYVTAPTDVNSPNLNF